jgi:hypothetical protein
MMTMPFKHGHHQSVWSFIFHLRICNSLMILISTLLLCGHVLLYSFVSFCCMDVVFFLFVVGVDNLLIIKWMCQWQNLATLDLEQGN